MDLVRGIPDPYRQCNEPDRLIEYLYNDGYLMRVLFLLISIVILTGIAAASTVTLTGTCYSKIINQTNNYITFNLTNSGNGTATNFLIEPIIDGANSLNSTLLIPLVAPGSTYSERVYLTNFTTPGSYVQRFVTRYSQGTSTFVTLFPCLVNIGQNAQSILAITNLSQSSKGNNISFSISNIANYPISAQVSVYAPPDFSIQNSTRNISFSQYSSTGASFEFTKPQYTNAEFPIVIAASYTAKDVHYATLAVTTISFGGPAATSAPTSNILLFLIITLIVIILVLIIISVMKKRKRSAEHYHKQDTNDKIT